MQKVKRQKLKQNPELTPAGLVANRWNMGAASVLSDRHDLHVKAIIDQLIAVNADILYYAYFETDLNLDLSLNNTFENIVTNIFVEPVGFNLPDFAKKIIDTFYLKYGSQVIEGGINRFQAIIEGYASYDSIIIILAKFSGDPAARKALIHLLENYSNYLNPILQYLLDKNRENLLQIITGIIAKIFADKRLSRLEEQDYFEWQRILLALGKIPNYEDMIKATLGNKLQIIFSAECAQSINLMIPENARLLSSSLKDLCHSLSDLLYCVYFRNKNALHDRVSETIGKLFNWDNILDNLPDYNLVKEFMDKFQELYPDIDLHKGTQNERVPLPVLLMRLNENSRALDALACLFEQKYVNPIKIVEYLLDEHDSLAALVFAMGLQIAVDEAGDNGMSDSDRVNWRKIYDRLIDLGIDATELQQMIGDNYLELAVITSTLPLPSRLFI